MSAPSWPSTWPGQDEWRQGDESVGWLYPRDSAIPTRAQIRYKATYPPVWHLWLRVPPDNGSTVQHYTGTEEELLAKFVAWKLELEGKLTT